MYPNQHSRGHEFSRIRSYSAVFTVFLSVVLTRCSEDAAQCRIPALKLAYSTRRHRHAEDQPRPADPVVLPAAAPLLPAPLPHHPRGPNPGWIRPLWRCGTRRLTVQEPTFQEVAVFYSELGGVGGDEEGREGVQARHVLRGQLGRQRTRREEGGALMCAHQVIVADA